MNLIGFKDILEYTASLITKGLNQKEKKRGEWKARRRKEEGVGEAGGEAGAEALLLLFHVPKMPAVASPTFPKYSGRSWNWYSMLYATLIPIDQTALQWC